MPLFPDMPVPPIPPLAPSNGADPLPPDLTTGVIPGLEAALLESLRNYNPGDVGVAQVGPQIQLNLAIPEWGWWNHPIKGVSASIAAASALTVDLFTVPDNYRMILYSIWMAIFSGDNTLDQFSIVQPTGYLGDMLDAQQVYLNLATPAVPLMWPDLRGQQTITEWLEGPVLLEPGTILRVKPSGAGASASTVGFHTNTRATKLIRQSAP